MTHFASIHRARSAIALLSLVGLAAMAPAVAEGHAAFQDASPEPGARLQTAPTQITLAFTEPLNRQLSIDERTGRVLQERMITQQHLTRSRFEHFDRPERIDAPHVR